MHGADHEGGGGNTGCPSWLFVPRIVTIPHLGTCPFQFQTGKKMKFWKLGVHSLERCTGCLQRPGKVIVKATLPAGTARACCPSFPGEGEGLESHCITDSVIGPGTPGTSLGCFQCPPLWKCEAPPIPASPQAPGPGLCFAGSHSLLLPMPSSSRRAGWDGLRPSKVTEWQGGPAVLQSLDTRGI